MTAAAARAVSVERRTIGTMRTAMSGSRSMDDSSDPIRDSGGLQPWAGQSAFKSRAAALSPATPNGFSHLIRLNSGDSRDYWRHAVAAFGADTAPTGGDRSIRPERAVGTVRIEDRPCSSGSCLRRSVRLPAHLHW